MSTMKRSKNFINRTGLVYGKLTVVSEAGFSKYHQRTFWNCDCDCGNKCSIQGKLLSSGTTKSCGCLRRKPLDDLSGKKFGFYTVIRFVDNNIPEKRVNRFLCRCDCGTENVLTSSQINSSKTQSCGCKTNEIISRKKSTHGATRNGKRTKEYRTWRSIKDRCYLKTSKSYHNYGGRGIVMCQAWLNSFGEFFKDMGMSPLKISSIERINNKGNYEPGNCEWSTPKLQARNKRTNIFATHAGKNQCSLDWSSELKIPYWTVLRRLKIGKTIAKIKSEFGR